MQHKSGVVHARSRSTTKAGSGQWLTRVAGLLLAAYLLSLLLTHALGMDSGMSIVLAAVTECAAVALSWRAVRAAGIRRWEVTLAAAAVTLYVLGDAIYAASQASLESLTTGSPAVLAYLMFPVLMIGSLGVVIVRQLRDRLWPVLLDGLVATLAAASVVSILLAPMLDRAFASPVTPESVVSVAYALLDIAVVAAVAGTLATPGLDLGKRWPILLAGLVFFTAADVVYALGFAGYAIGTWVDGGWMIGLVAVAYWLDGARCPTPSIDPHALVTPRLSAPVTAIVAALSVLLLASQTWVPMLAVLFAGLTLAAAAVPLAFRHKLQQNLVRTDDLTGLLNRRALQTDTLPYLLEGREGALLLLDLDRFKDVNDGFGHDVGDGVLTYVGQRLVSQVRPAGLVGRLGGDEFAVFLDGATVEAATETAIRIQEALAEPFSVAGHAVETSASIGIALYPDHGSTLDSLLRNADDAMYRAKADHSGHHLYQVDYDARREIRFRTVQELRLALATGQLEAHYQPKVCSTTAQVVGVEALARWRHPARGLLAPESFLHLAEEAGLMPQLTEVMLEQALDQASQWQSEGLNLAVAVNVSTSCLRPDLPQQITRLLSDRNLPASVLVLEITEEVVMLEGQRTLEVLADLRARGVEISIDDFGTGYSSLAYLRDLPIDELKLDKSFISPMREDRRAASLVASIINLAHSLGLRIVAEGVDNEAAYGELTQRGCDIIQGYHLSKPIPAAELSSWVRQRGLATEPA